ncbi:HlyD family efflux transporter periplasmic adaptor subunit [Kovacikia minuta CCNUW1]|uniref:HlyD family efflux transporter periplasmic adaptor subunit n=1 Tax=Kovacikia minuta TaxID=2931930 RepID=UPI001CCEE396|nr:HlyD family efflux transporter periplasmic adaptor subunit [Kovacikia minuta]UBF24733.1 HlyD family efflux transporter periplasmic adaptor subunit [Kovacikia minuta CCNUW1]
MVLNTERSVMLDSSDPDLPPLQNEEFLPPISRWTTWGGLLLAGTVGGMVALSGVIQYNVTVQAPASVRPARELSVVQSAIEGTVSEIKVQENQPVQQGAVIAEVNVIDRARLEALEVRQTALQGYIKRYKAQLDGINKQLQSPNGKRSSAQRDRLLQQRVGLQNQIGYDEDALQRVSAEIDKQVIRAPADGTILKLEVRNPGQAVRLGDTIAQIVPKDSPLLVKARVAAQDISRVTLGQPAQMRISAYPYPDYGVLKGTVKAIAPDVTTVQDSGNGAFTFYEVTIQPDQPYLTRNNQQYPLQPGMDGRADIISRQETLMQFILRKARLWSDL